MKLWKLNFGPNHLSWIKNGKKPTSLDERLYDAKLIIVHIADEHLVDIIQFLSTGVAPKGYMTL